MPRDYINQNDAGFLQQLIAFNANIGTYAVDLGLSDGELGSINADKDYFAYIIGSIEVMRNANTQWTAWRDIVRDGGDVATEAKVPVLPAVASMVLPGIEPRFRALASRIKTHPNYNEAMGKALGIITEAAAPLDLAGVKPALALLLNGNDVRVQWGWGPNRGPLQLCEIHVDRNDTKGFVLLTFDTTPNYIDTHPQPAAPVVWTYKAIYRANDRQVGQWSDPVSITVRG